MDGTVAVAREMNEVVAIYKFSLVFVFEIACFSTSTGFSWDHHEIFATLSSRLVKIPGHTDYYFMPTGTRARHRPKFWDCPGQTGTLSNYVSLIHQQGGDYLWRWSKITLYITLQNYTSWLL